MIRASSWLWSRRHSSCCDYVTQNPPVPEVMAAWHDLYMLVGSASATLVGLLFVAASVGSRFYTRDRYPAVRAFLSPSVVHFTSVLVACLIAVAPIRSSKILAGLLGSDGLFGLLYAVHVWRNIIRHSFTTVIDLEDRVWYAVLPAVGYVIMIAASVTFPLEVYAGCGVLALAMIVLLLVGIRNAWDMTVFTIIRTD